MASLTPQLSNLPLEDPPAGRPQPTMSSLEAKVESVVGINIVSLQQSLSNDASEDEHMPTERFNNQSGLGDRAIMLPNTSGSGSPQKLGAAFQGQGQHFEPLDKSVSQTVKLNPKMELSKPDLLKLLSYMEAELQARDVVIATLKTERIKNLLHYGRVGLNDPFLALQRDNIGGQVFGGGNVSEGELRSIEETQLQQLENLITQQRKAHQRMRQVLREAEKRHSSTVEELEKERRKNESESAQGDDATYHLEKDKTRLKQFQELDSERAGKKKVEKELKKLQETLEEERGKQKQIILMLVEERKRLALQYVEERKRSEDLAQILSEEKGRIDSMAEGLEEESKKSLQMEAELEKQLAEFDTEKQQMGAQIARKDDRISELEALAEKLQREVEHYKKQLQEAHNVAMFQQTLSVSPPRIGIGTSPQRPQPPQLPVKPPSLAQGQSRLQAAPAHSNVTKAVQLTATVNSVPVAGPTTGIARGVQPGIGVRSSMYSASTSEISRPITSTAKSYSESESGWVAGAVVECDIPAPPSTTTPQGGGDRSLARVSIGGGGGGSQCPQVVQVSPRVNVSASSSSKVITTSHGGKVTFHVTTNASPGAGGPSGGMGAPGDQQTILKKPAPPTRSSQAGPPPPVPLNKPLGAPPVPPNKPVVPPKKVLDPPPISMEVKPQKGGPQTVKFGITISKTSGGSQAAASAAAAASSNRDVSPSPSSAAAVLSPVAIGGGGGGVEGAMAAARRENSQQVEEEAKCEEVHECVDSLCHELENFHQLLSSMADHSDLVETPSPSPLHPPSGPKLYSSSYESSATPPSLVDGVSLVIKSSDSKELMKKNANVIASSSSPLSASAGGCCYQGKQPPHHLHEEQEQVSCEVDKPGSLAAFSSSSSSSSPPPPPSCSPPSSPSSPLSSSSVERNVTPYFLSHLPVTSFPLVSECEESASTQACKGPPMSIPLHPTSSSPPSSFSSSSYSSSSSSSSMPTSLSSTCSSSPPPPPSSSTHPPRPHFLPIDSTLDSNPEDYCAPPPHSPIDVATPLTADGMTALHLAAQGNNWQSVAVLVRCGSSVSAEDDEGRTPLYVALLYGCVAAAKALLAFEHCFEHTTKSGCNVVHAATKSGEVECVSLVTQHIVQTDAEGGPSLLHLLATSPDHAGHTPIALSLAATSPGMTRVFRYSCLDLNTLIAHNPLLLHIASPAAISQLSVQDDEDFRCSVWIKGIPVGSEKEEDVKWAIGTVLVGPSESWTDLEADIISVLSNHLEVIDRCGRGDGLRAETSSCPSESADEKKEDSLGLSESCIECLCIAGHYWKKGVPQSGLVPFELLQKKKKKRVKEEEESHVVLHLRPLPAVAYTCLIPVFLLQSYLRLLDQSKCVVVYGASSSGKRTLAGCLASLWRPPAGEEGGEGREEERKVDEPPSSSPSPSSSPPVRLLDLSDPSTHSSIGRSVDDALRTGRVLVLHRLPRDAWPLLWGAVKRGGGGGGGGRVVATMDSWRRPAGQLDSDHVLWIQLRHDRAPLRHHLSRFLMRQVASVAAGVAPPRWSLCCRTVRWVTETQGRLSDTLMSLGFSDVLRGPGIVARALAGAVNPLDIVRSVERVWNMEMVPAIVDQVRTVWKMSPLFEAERAPNEGRVSAMALHVIFHRSFLAGWPHPSKRLLSGCRGFEPPSRPPKEQDHSSVKSNNSHKLIPSSPASPEWNEDSLAKILGLPPVGYA